MTGLIFLALLALALMGNTLALVCLIPWLVYAICGGICDAFND